MEKLKQSAAAVVLIAAGAAVGWFGLYRFRPGKLLAAILLLTAGILFLCKLLPRKNETAGSKLPKIAALIAVASLAVSSGPDAMIPYRPMYVYQNYYHADRLNPAVFPEVLPDGASEVRFRALGEGIARSPILALSFRTDAASAEAFRKNAEAHAESVSACEAVDMISADVAPSFMQRDNIMQCTVYRFADWYGKECRIYIHNEEPLICCYQN